MFLGASTLLTLCIAGGTRFNTVTNGIVVFGFYAMAFIGGWVEEIGFVLGMKPTLLQELRMGPFSTAAVPSGAMVVWAVGFVFLALALALALRQFQKLPL